MRGWNSAHQARFSNGTWTIPAVGFDYIVAKLVVARDGALVAGGAFSIVDGAASARYCDRDSTLTIISIGSRWSAVIGMRTTWPPVRRFTVDTAIGLIGTAAVAARAVNDSAPPALISRSGTLELDTTEVLSGRFTVETGRESTLVGLSGRFLGLRRDSIGCPAA